MRILCAWCRKEGRPSLVGQREPLEDATEAIGLCPDHRTRLADALEGFRQEGLLRGGGGLLASLWLVGGILALIVGVTALVMLRDVPRAAVFSVVLIGAGAAGVWRFLGWLRERGDELESLRRMIDG